MALCGHPRIHSALAPLGPRCSEGGKATEGFCQFWAGAGSRELLSWLRSVAWRGPGGLLRSGRIPGLAALVGIALSKRKCLSGRKETRPAFSFCPFSHSRDYGFLPGLAPPEGLVLGEPQVAPPLPLIPLLQTWRKGMGAAVRPGAHSCLTAGAHPEEAAPLGRSLRAQACAQKFRPGFWAAGCEGKGPADRLPSPSSPSCQAAERARARGLQWLVRDRTLSGFQLLDTQSGFTSQADTLCGGVGVTAVQNRLRAHPGKSPRWSVR